MARTRRRRLIKTMFIDVVCRDRISRTTGARRVVKGARCCLQEPLRKVTENSALPG